MKSCSAISSVARPLGDPAQDLALPLAENLGGLTLRGRRRRRSFAVRIDLKLPQDPPGDLFGDPRLALHDRVEILGPLLRRQVFQEVPLGPCADRLKEVLRIVGDGHDDDPHVRHLRFDLAGGGEAVLARQIDVHQDHVGHQLPGHFDRLQPVGRIAHHLKGGIFA